MCGSGAAAVRGPEPDESNTLRPVGRCAGKVVVITGVRRGIGVDTVRALVDAGATVVATDRNEAEGLALVEDVMASLGPSSGSVEFVRLDVTQPDDWVSLSYRLSDVHGRVDGLVNNAAVLSRDRLPEVDLDLWERTFQVNVTGPMLGMKYLVPMMPPGSSIVNVCSIVATSGHVAAAFTASKWALRGLTRTASLEFGPRGVRVNAVLPGLIDTPILCSASPALVDAALSEIPLGRIGAPSEVTPAIVFLVSDESSFMSGAELLVDGGQSGHASHKAIADATAARPKALPGEGTPPRP